MDSIAPLDIAIATCESHPGFCAGDDHSLIEQLEELNITATPAIWNNPKINWQSFDAVLIRTTWDYTANLEEFITWMRRVDLQAIILNPPDVAVSNLEKTYLKKLGDAAVPTVWIERDASVREVDAAFADAASRGWERVVLKPVIGAGAEDLMIGDLSKDIMLRAHISRIQKRCAVMLQPLIEGVRTRGELSVVLIEGAITHAVRKTPKGQDYRVQIEFGGKYELETPVVAALHAVEAARVLWDERRCTRAGRSCGARAGGVFDY